MDLEAVLTRIEQRLEALGLSAHAASQAAGKPDAIRNLRRAVESKSRRGLSTATISALAPILRTSTAWLMDGTGPEELTTTPDAPLEAKTRHPSTHGEYQAKKSAKVVADLSKPMKLVHRPLTGTLRRYSQASARHLGAVVIGQIFEEISAPVKLDGVEGAYACDVHGETMKPAVRAGDTVFCHPHKPIKKEDLVAVQIQDKDETIALIRQFVSQDEQEIVVERLNPYEVQRFPRSEVLALHKVEVVDKV